MSVLVAVATVIQAVANVAFLALYIIWERPRKKCD